MTKYAVTGLFLFSLMRCTTNNKISMQENNDLEIVRNQFQRGRVEYQIITSTKTLTILNNDTIVKPTTKANWEKVNQLVEKIHLSDLHNLTISQDAKTHQFDASSAANIKISCNQSEYKTPAYDKGKAPKEIYELDQFLASLSK